jgi:L-asparaginase
MAYTASALSFMLNNLKKPVIYRFSIAIGDLRTDAKENLLTSLYYASLYENNEALQEVALYFEYKLLRGNRCLKYSAENFDAFISPNYPILGESEFT